MLPFFSTHNHTEISNFRLRDCIIKLDELINRAVELGYNGICCTDHEALSGHVRLIKRYKDLKKWRSILDKYETWEELEQKEDKDDVKKIKKNMKWLEKFSSDFKLGLGNEIYLIDRPEEAEKIAKFYHFILIAKDAKGYEQLRRISSSAWEHWFKQGRMERVPTYKDELEAIIGDEKGHIIAQSACLGSELDNLILRYLETNDIVYKKSTSTSKVTKDKFTWTHFYITLISICVPYLLIALVSLFLGIFAPDFFKVWFVRIIFYGVSASFVVWLVFAVLWWPSLWEQIICSFLVWSVAISINISFKTVGTLLIYGVAIVLQIAIVLWWLLKRAYGIKKEKWRMLPQKRK